MRLATEASTPRRIIIVAFRTSVLGAPLSLTIGVTNDPNRR